MSKRGNVDSQLSKEQLADKEEEDEEQSAGTWQKASADELRKRKIVTGRRPSLTGSAADATPAKAGSGFAGFSFAQSPPPAAQPFSSFSFTSPVAATAAAPAGLAVAPTAPAAAPAFAGFNISTAAAASSTSSTSASPAFSFTLGSQPLQLPKQTSPKPAASATAAASSQKPQVSFSKPESSQDAGLQQDMKALNAKFVRWVDAQLTENPDEPWLEGVGDYITFAGKLLDKHRKAGSSSSSSGASSSSTAALPFSTAAVVPSSTAAAPFSFTSFTNGSSSSAAGSGGFRMPSVAGAFTAAAASDASGAAAAGAATEDSNDEKESEGADDHEKEQAPSELGRAAGEEDEEVVHEVRTKLIKLAKGTDGKMASADLGLGVLRAMKHKTTDKRRLVMRNDIGKVQLNAGLYPGMTFKREKLFVMFNAADAEGGGMTRFGLKSKAADIDAFKAVLDKLVPASS